MAAARLQGRQERALGHTCSSQHPDKDLGTVQWGSTLFVLIPPEASPAGLCVFASAFGVSCAGREVRSLPESVTFYLETRHGPACLGATPMSGGSGRRRHVGSAFWGDPPRQIHASLPKAPERTPWRAQKWVCFNSDENQSLILSGRVTGLATHEENLMFRIANG